MPATVVSGLRDYSLGQAQAALEAGDFSAAEYLAQTRSEISRLEPALRAFISLTELTPPAPGQPGVLTGLTFSVKDTIEVAGAPTTAGSRLLLEHVPARTAGVVRRLQAAGAVLAGQTNCAELGIRHLET